MFVADIAATPSFYFVNSDRKFSQSTDLDIDANAGRLFFLKLIKLGCRVNIHLTDRVKLLNNLLRHTTLRYVIISHLIPVAQGVKLTFLPGASAMLVWRQTNTGLGEPWRHRPGTRRPNQLLLPACLSFHSTGASRVTQKQVLCVMNFFSSILYQRCVFIIFYTT